MTCGSSTARPGVMQGRGLDSFSHLMSFDAALKLSAWSTMLVHGRHR